MIIPKRKETEQETFNRLFALIDGKDYGVFPPPMKAQVAIDELCRFFLGDEWYTVNPISTEQINTEIVYEIERKFNRYRKDK